MRTRVIFTALILGTAACGGQEAKNATFDTPIPSQERRASLRVVLDLPPISDCDERFDLSLYQDRGVELVAWEGAGHGCTGRVAKIRYVPGRITRPALLERIKKLARKIEAVDG